MIRKYENILQWKLFLFRHCISLIRMLPELGAKCENLVHFTKQRSKLLFVMVYGVYTQTYNVEFSLCDLRVYDDENKEWNAGWQMNILKVIAYW